MNNLTKQWGNNPAVPTELDLGDIGAFEMDDNNWKALDNIVQRLNAYEKTGLEPNEIHNWIPVDKEMPKEHEVEQDIYDPETLAFIDTNRNMCSDLVNVIVINNETEERFICDDITTNGQWVNFPKELYTVTHWMSLPKLPAIKQ